MSFPINNNFPLTNTRIGGEKYQRYSQPSFTESNSNQFQQNTYDSVYTKNSNEQLSTQVEPNVEYETTEFYLTLSSRDRDTTLYPNVNSYAIAFPNEFRNISSIELVQAIIPDQNSASSEPYLLLKIAEIEDVMISNDRNISDAFAILQPSSPTTTGGFMQLDKRIHENTVKHFKVPKASLAKITLTITDINGALFNFGTDTNPPQKALQNTFVFKIICMEKKRNQLNHRNVY